MILLLKNISYQFKLYLKNIFYSLLSIFKIITLSKFKYKIPRKFSKEVIVIGNAPSFQKDFNEFPDFFQTKDLICVNNFPSSDLYGKIKPTALVFIDNSYYPKNGKLKDFAQKAIDDFIKKTTWDIELFIPQLAKYSIILSTISEKNSHIKIQYFNYTIVDGFQWFRNWAFSNNWGMPLCKNVALAAIYIGINSRYTNIYLSGIENSFFKDIHLDDENRLFMGIPHFYTVDNQIRYANVYANPDTNEIMDMTDFFKLCQQTFGAYKILSSYAKYMNTNIINTTPQSYVDVFPKRSINDLVRVAI